MENIGYNGSEFGCFLALVFLIGIAIRNSVDRPLVIVKEPNLITPKDTTPVLDLKVEIDVPEKPVSKKEEVPEPEPELLTDQSIKDDAIGCLRSLGYKKKESTDVVNNLADRIEYRDVDALLKDILKGKR
jgi:hypothetical protein